MRPRPQGLAEGKLAREDRAQHAKGTKREKKTFRRCTRRKIRTSYFHSSIRGTFDRWIIILSFQRSLRGWLGGGMTHKASIWLNVSWTTGQPPGLFRLGYPTVGGSDARQSRVKQRDSVQRRVPGALITLYTVVATHTPYFSIYSIITVKYHLPDKIVGALVTSQT